MNGTGRDRALHGLVQAFVRTSRGFCVLWTGKSPALSLIFGPDCFREFHRPKGLLRDLPGEILRALRLLCPLSAKFPRAFDRTLDVGLKGRILIFLYSRLSSDDNELSLEIDGSGEIVSPESPCVDNRKIVSVVRYLPFLGQGCWS